MYKVIRNAKYDYAGQKYDSLYPNLHKYPAAMLPQIGIDILKEFNISTGRLLDPYCGSGSSFLSALECGIETMSGYDINPLAVLISNVKLTKLSIKEIEETKNIFRNGLFEFLKDESNAGKLKAPQVTNIDFWFSKETILNLTALKYFIDKIKNKKIKNFFLIPFSLTVRECSYTRNDEFKLYKMKSEDILNFNPDAISFYFKKLNETLIYYSNFYLPKLNKKFKADISYSKFRAQKNSFDIVLTSPPYGDSKTTVSYGQFSALSNEWLGFNYARKIDSMLMGGSKEKINIPKGLISDYIFEISKTDKKRAGEVSAFYNDLETSIKEVAASVVKKGKAVYIAGNRNVKNVLLPTDQFISEKFEENGFKHLITYERKIGSKSMPYKNSPSNKAGKTSSTMLKEYIVISEKV